VRLAIGDRGFNRPPLFTHEFDPAEQVVHTRTFASVTKQCNFVPVSWEVNRHTVRCTVSMDDLAASAFVWQKEEESPINVTLWVARMARE